MEPSPGNELSSPAPSRAVPSRDAQVHSGATGLLHLAASARPKHRANRSPPVYFVVLSSAAFSVSQQGSHVLFPTFTFKVEKPLRAETSAAPRQQQGAQPTAQRTRPLTHVEQSCVSTQLSSHSPSRLRGCSYTAVAAIGCTQARSKLASFGVRNCSRQSPQGQTAPDKRSVTYWSLSSVPLDLHS